MFWKKAVTNQNIQNTIIPLFSGHHCTLFLGLREYGVQTADPGK